MRVYTVCFLAVLLAAACSPVKVQTDLDSTVDFSIMRSFDWLDNPEPPGDNVRVNNPKLDALVRAAAEKNLLEKGYVKEEKADFLVNWLGAIESKVKTESIQHFYSGYGYGTMPTGRTAKGKDAVAVGSYEEGTIVIDILDPQKHIILWRGAGTRRLTKGMDEGQVVRYVNLSVKEILKSFPKAGK